MLRIGLLFIMLTFSFWTQAGLDVVQKHVPHARKVGSGDLYVGIWKIYSATLYAPDGKWSNDAPFALSLEYNRDIKGNDIAEASIHEIQKLGFNHGKTIDKWRKVMKDVFPDVKQGDRITGVLDQRNTSHFYLNDQFIGQINDKEFGQNFFDIWLNENTSKPKLRQKLISANSNET